MPVLSLEEVELAYAAICIAGIVPRVSLVPFLGIGPRVGRLPASWLANTTVRTWDLMNIHFAVGANVGKSV